MYEAVEEGARRDDLMQVEECVDLRHNGLDLRLRFVNGLLEQRRVGARQYVECIEETVRLRFILVLYNTTKSMMLPVKNPHE